MIPMIARANAKGSPNKWQLHADAHHSVVKARLSVRHERTGWEYKMLKNAEIVPYIPVSNMARAREFYEDKIGLIPKEEYAGGVIYECGNGSRVFMYPSGGAGTSKASTAFWA